MRICLVYDCLYPHTVGGAERWYRDLAERLVEEGHEVTYLTLRQWDRGERPQIDARVRVVIAGPRMALYTESGRRRILPPLVFGLGVFAHLLRNGRRYDVVHTCAFPYFSLLAAAPLRKPMGFGLVVDWFEVWSRVLLARLPGLAGRAHRRARTAWLRPRPPARLLLLRAARAAVARGAPQRDRDGAARALRGQPRASRTAGGGADRAVRGAADPREAGDAGGSRDGACRPAHRGAEG